MQSPGATNRFMLFNHWNEETATRVPCKQLNPSPFPLGRLPQRRAGLRKPRFIDNFRKIF